MLWFNSYFRSNLEKMATLLNLSNISSARKMGAWLGLVVIFKARKSITPRSFSCCFTKKQTGYVRGATSIYLTFSEQIRNIFTSHDVLRKGHLKKKPMESGRVKRYHNSVIKSSRRGKLWEPASTKWLQEARRRDTPLRKPPP